MKTIPICLIGFAVILSAGRVAAQEPAFGDAGHLAISADRLFGFVHSKRTQTMAGVTMSESLDSVTLFTNPLGGASGYAWPRIAFDGFVTRGLSIGGSLGYFNFSPSSGSLSGFLVAPRIGYAVRLGPAVSIWPRGGITYLSVSSESGTGGSTSTVSAVALTLEAPLMFQAAPRAFILVGPTVDLGLSGSRSSGATSIDETITDFGFQTGLLLLI